MAWWCLIWYRFSRPTLMMGLLNLPIPQSAFLQPSTPVLLLQAVVSSLAVVHMAGKGRGDGWPEVLLHLLHTEIRTAMVLTRKGNCWHESWSHLGLEGSGAECCFQQQRQRSNSCLANPHPEHTPLNPPFSLYKQIHTCTSQAHSSSHKQKYFEKACLCLGFMPQNGCCNFKVGQGAECGCGSLGSLGLCSKPHSGCHANWTLLCCLASLVFLLA